MEHDEFLTYLQFEKRYSLNTIQSYRDDLEQFFVYLEQNVGIEDIAEITHHHVRSWGVSMMNNYSPVSVRRKFSTLRSYFKYLRQQGSLAINPMDKVKAPKIGKRVPEFVDETTLEKLFDREELFFTDDYEGVLDKTIVYTFYATGIRRSELIGLRTLDVELDRRILKVLGKRNKERLIPFNHRTLKVLRDYLNYKTLKFDYAQDIPQFFIDINGRPLTAGKVYRIVNKYLSQVSTLKKTSPHVLRHSFATHMLDNGADINSIKEILGHSNLAVTQIYTHSTIEKLKNVYNQTHPLEVGLNEGDEYES